MTDGAQTYRLGIAVFPRPDGIWPVVIALLDGGLCLHQLCFAASARTLALLPSTATAFRDRQPALEHVIDRVASAGPLPNSAGDRLVVHFGRVRDGATVEAGDRNDWLRPELFSSVLEHLIDDQIVLGVSSESTRQQLVSTRILLEHSSQRVLTQEFILPAHH